jgi:hypothetical protein
MVAREKHLLFSEDPVFCLNHKTRRFIVYSRFDNTKLGEVKWYARWRQYCFFPEGECVWSLDCLEDLTVFVHDLTKQKRLTLLEEK